MEDEKPKHVRRVRYSGTHPKNFKEKYKEQNPELYPDDIAKVMERGQTPAGMHRSICVNEILEILNPQPGETGLDATLGYGGHSLELLKKISPGGKLYATDVDPIELPRTTERLAKQGFGENILRVRKMNFSSIDLIVSESGPLDFVLADLGLSSMQIDNPERGFTFKVDGPLDLRLNPNSGKTAAALLKTYSQEELEEILLINSDEPHYEAIARSISVRMKKGIAIETTFQLKEAITDALDRMNMNKDEIRKSCQRTFQALRIEVNDEFKALEQFLDKLPDALAQGGRVAILTFHSGEDRRVKKAFQYFYREGIFSEISPEPIRASAQECFSNPRAKSAKLRWGIKAK